MVSIRLSAHSPDGTQQLRTFRGDAYSQKQIQKIDLMYKQHIHSGKPKSAFTFPKPFELDMPEEKKEKSIKEHFPFRKIDCVKMPDNNCFSWLCIGSTRSGKSYAINYIYETYFPTIPINYTLSRYMVKKAMRSNSGVLVSTIVLKPSVFSCTEECLYCPTETDLEGNPTQPKSYISTEPAMLRASRNNFGIREQIIDRVRSHIYTGNLKNDIHNKKIEVILVGGTWDVMPKKYRDDVINEIYYTFNTIININREMLSLDKEKQINETSKFRVIGLTIETRPDYITKKSLLEYLNYGVTRVQIGGQSTHYDILLKIKRGCTVKNIINAIRLLKGIGMKVVTHWMPDLPNSSPEKDNQMFERLNTDPDLQSDDWKIYPCAVVKSASPDLIIKSEINEWYENGSYIQYAEQNIQDLIDVCINAKKNVNPWVRIERLIRDIPTQSITAGYKKIANLRQIIHEEMTKQNIYCKCIRCMEIKDRGDLINYGKLVVRKYIASDGIEYHITYELEKYYWTISFLIFTIMYYINKLFFNKIIYYSGNNEMYNGLFGFLRLRIDKNPGLDIIPELKNAGLIREVHVYGLATNVGDNNSKSSQHKGIGKLLLCTAENIIKSHNLKKTAIIAGVGAREYYRKNGYHYENNYMLKAI
jgi:ELP3 family radical SAM enzyme/protein acetyltransferase